jgi:hypothetical protein
MKRKLLPSCKYLSAALLLLAGSGLNGQNNKTGSAEHYHSYNNGSYTWIDMDSASFTYDNSNKLTSNILYIADSNNIYSPYYESQYSYTNYDSSAVVLNLVHDMNQVDSSDKVIYFRDGNHFLTKTESQTYIPGFGWRNTSQQLFTRDGNGNMLSQEYQSWDTLNNVFVPMLYGQKIVYTYDGNNHVTSSTITQYDGSNYINSMQETFTYQGNLLSMTMRGYWVGSQWLTDSKDSLVYDGNSKLIGDYYFYELYSGVAPWILSQKNVYTYDGNNNQIALSSWGYNSLTMNYETQAYAKWVNEYDNNNHLKKTTHQTWDTLTLAYIDVEDLVMYYGNPAGIKQITGNANTNVFPNPFTNVIHVNTQNNASVSLYDITGKEMYNTSSNGNQLIINTDHLPNGIYFLKTTSPQEQSVQKIMKLN